MNFFKSIFKRNQIIVFTIGLMIITAGYLSYVNNNKETEGITASSIADSEEMASIGDAKLVSANVAESANSINSNTITEEADDNSITNNMDANTINANENNETDFSSTEENKINNEIESTVATSSNDTQDIDSYFTSSRLERESMYSQRIENYHDILN